MEIETNRLILREFTEDDWPDVLAFQSDPRYQRYYPITEPTPKKAQEFVRLFLRQQQEQPRRKFQLAVTLKSSPKLIGNCGLRMKTAVSHQADIGYEFAPEHWGNGYATEAAQAIVHFGFTTFNLHRIWAWCIAENQGSIHVLEKLGMQQEGHLRENEYFQNRWWDTLIYAILESEWQVQQTPPPNI